MTIYTQNWGNLRGIRIPKIISLNDKLNDFDGEYELTEEDKVWLNMKPEGKEIW